MFRQYEITSRGIIAGGLVTVFFLADATSAFAFRPRPGKPVVSLVNASRTKNKVSKRIRATVPAIRTGQLRRLNGYPRVPAVIRRRNPIAVPTRVRRVISSKPAVRPGTVVVSTNPAELTTVLPVRITDNDSNVISGKVLKVVEGRTVLVDTGTGLTTVRLLGVDLMTVDGSHSTESARLHLAELVENQQVVLSFDDMAARQDEDGFTVAYLRRQNDSALINQRMIGDGYALAATTYDYQLFDVLVSEQLKAQEANVGIWAGVETTMR